LQVITKNLVDSIHNKEIELDAENKKKYPIIQKKEHEHKIKIIENAIKKFKEKYADIKEKIYQLNGDYCPICMSSFINPVIVNCCKNCFCFDCLAVSMGELKNNICPFCRQGISKNDIFLISNDDKFKKSIDANSKYGLKDKLDVLVELINKKPNGSFMVFANYPETFSKIESRLCQLDISYHILKGNATTVQKHINDFQNKNIRVLMLNAQFFGAGMNLQMTTDLIIYHRFTKEMEEQIIGRAQRMGRTTPLNVYYLIHDNESNNIQDKFNFEDIKNIHYLDWIEQSEQIKEKNNTETFVHTSNNENHYINKEINTTEKNENVEYIEIKGRNTNHTKTNIDTNYDSDLSIKSTESTIKISKKSSEKINTNIYEESESSIESFESTKAINKSLKKSNKKNVVINFDNIDMEEFAIVK
jgi:hypothetical protein